MNELFSNDWISFIFFIIFLLLGVCKFIYNERLFQLLVLFLSKKYIVKYSKDSNLILNGFNALIYTVLVLVLGLFGLFLIGYSKPEIVAENSLAIYLKVVLGITSYFLARYLLGLGLGYLFQVKNEQQMLSFVKMSYFFSVSLLIFPFLIFVFFVKSHYLLLFKVTFAIFATLLIARYIIVFNSNKNRVFEKKFNFFLYLCALEIAPLLVISKMIISV